MKLENRRYLAADSAARRLKPNIEAGTTQSSVQTTESFRKFGVKTTLTSAEKAIVRKPADFSENFLNQTSSAYPTKTGTVCGG